MSKKTNNDKKWDGNIHNWRASQPAHQLWFDRMMWASIVISVLIGLFAGIRSYF